jgi:hypothetical protein
VKWAPVGALMLAPAEPCVAARLVAPGASHCLGRTYVLFRRAGIRRAGAPFGAHCRTGVQPVEAHAGG